MLQQGALDLCSRLGRRFRVRGKPLTVAGVAKPPAHIGGVKPGQRRETHPNECARSSGTSNEGVKRPRPVGVQGFESPPPHQCTGKLGSESQTPSLRLVESAVGKVVLGGWVKSGEDLHHLMSP